MAESKPEPTHLPVDSKLEPRSYVLGVGFHPPIKLDRKTGFNFASTLADYIDPQNAQLSDQSWIFGQQIGNSVSGGLQIAVSPSQIQFDFSMVTQSLEWIEQRCLMVLETFGKRFNPKLILNAMAAFHGIMQIDGDARVFLAQRLMNLKPEQLNLLHRPLHLFGIRFFLPPYQPKEDGDKSKNSPRKKSVKQNVINWMVEVKAESLMEDPTKLYLEAEAQWPEPKPWSADTIKGAVGHLATVSDYVRDDVVDFLQKASGENLI